MKLTYNICAFCMLLLSLAFFSCSNENELVEDIPIQISDITLDKETAEVVKGDSLLLTATITPENATDKTVIWNSSNDSIATVVDGVVKAHELGEVIITATAGEFVASCVVTVKTMVVAVDSITLDKKSAEMVEGDSLVLTATVFPEAATDKTVKWTSSDESVATVVNGVVKAVNLGETVITASVGEFKATCIIQVKVFYGKYVGSYEAYLPDGTLSKNGKSQVMRIIKGENSDSLYMDQISFTDKVPYAFDIRFDGIKLMEDGKTLKLASATSVPEMIWKNKWTAMPQYTISGFSGRLAADSLYLDFKCGENILTYAGKYSTK